MATTAPTSSSFSLPNLKALFEQAARNWSSDNASNLSAAFSFYAILSLAPLLVLAVTIGGLYLGGEAKAHQEVVQYVASSVGPDASKYVDDILTAVHQQSKSSAGILATVISLGVTFFSASNLFLQLNLAVNRIWKLKVEGNPFRALLITRVVAFVGVLLFGALLLAWLILDSWISWVAVHANGFHGWQVVNVLVSLLFLAGVFLLSFKALPKGYVSWGDAVLAAIVTSVGVTAGKYLLGLYFAHAGVAKAYGSAGALVLILLWIYYTAQIYFFGVELTCTYAHTVGSRKDVDEQGLEHS